MRHLLLALLCLGFAGCLGSGAYTSISYYDFSPPEGAAIQPPDVLPKMLHISRFGALGPYGAKIVSRLGSQQLSFAEFHRWAQPPSDLVTRQAYLLARHGGRFAKVTPPHGQSGDLTLSGEILRFERMPDSSAFVEIEVTLMAMDGSILHDKVYSQQVSATAKTGLAFAKAMETALDNLLAQALEEVATAAR